MRINMKKKTFVMCVAIFVCTGLSAQPTSLDEVYEPVVVGVPPSDAYIGLSLLPRRRVAPL